VKQAIAACQKAGIKVRMVTGDSVGTAQSIAQEVGILTPGGVVLEGPVFMARAGGVICEGCRKQQCGCS
jgi:Ca2+-transporting ATPase